jgi:BASS family bile acid:Na+ symporter
MEFLLQVVMPVSMFLVMSIIGTELSTDDFRKLVERPWLVVAVSVCQLLVLPAVVFCVFRSFAEIPVAVMAGMLIMSAGPGGGLSNMLTAKAGGNTALSIALTSVGSVCCIVSMPLVFALALPYVARRAGNVELPIDVIVAQLVLFILIPVSLGMWCRYRWPEAVLSRQKWLRHATSALLVAVIGYSLAMKSTISSSEFFFALPYALAFMASCALLGLGFGRMFGLDRGDTRALVIEYSFQSAAIPTVIVVSIVRQMEWLLFVGAAGIMQLLFGLAIVASATLRSRGPAG